MNDYSTTDIYLAATLSALDYSLEEITHEGSKFIFHFCQTISNDPSIPISVDADQYWTGNLLVDPKRLFSEFKQIKARMYDQKRGNHG